MLEVFEYFFSNLNTKKEKSLIYKFSFNPKDLQTHAFFSVYKNQYKMHRNGELVPKGYKLTLPPLPKGITKFSDIYIKNTPFPLHVLNSKINYNDSDLSLVY